MVADSFTVSDGMIYAATPEDIRVIPVSGGAATTIALSGGYGHQSIAIADGKAFWTVFSPPSVMSAPSSGGTATTLAAGPEQPGPLVADSTGVYFSTTLNSLNVIQVPGGGGIETIVGAIGNAASLQSIHLTVDAGHVYFAYESEGTVGSIIKSGRSPLILASSQSRPSGIAVDSHYIYWTNGGRGGEKTPVSDGTITKVPLDGGTPIVLASGRTYPTSIAVDNESIYFTESAGARVMRLAK